MSSRCKFFCAMAAVLALARVLSAEELPQVDSLPVGETLKYDIYWGFIPVGHSEMTSSWVEENGKPLINLRFTARSNRFVEKIYPVDDRIDCFVDPETLLPARLVKRTSEGHYLCDDILTFDRASSMAFWEDRQNQTNCEYAVARDARDFYSLMYMMRVQDLQCGEQKRFTIASDDKTYDIDIRMGAEEKISLSDGSEVAATRLKVEQVQEGLFVRKIPGMVWVSREDPCVILKMQLRVPVGSVRLVLAGRQVGPEPTALRAESVRSSDRL